MAKWIISRLPGRGPENLRLVYVNEFTGVRFVCGSMSSDVPDEMVTDWILMCGGPFDGDVVEMSDGSVLTYRGNRFSVRDAKLDDGRVVRGETTTRA